MKQDINIPLSWYEATVQRGPLSVLTRPVTADVCVVGGGLAGLTTARELARAGKRVVLLEAGRIACGASGRNGGFVSDGFACGIGEVAAKVGLDASRKLFELSCQGTDYVRNTILENAPEVLMGQGLRLCVRHDDGGDLHRYGVSLARDYDVAVIPETLAQTRAALRTERYFSSIRFPRAFHIHPLRYALVLQNLCAAAGVEIFENSAVVSVETEGAACVVRTASGKVTAEHVVHCVSSTGRHLHRASGSAVLPVATYVAVTETLQQDAIATPEAIADTRRAGDYYRLVDGGTRILWGGRITTDVREPQRLAEVMRRDMLSVYPQLGAPRMDFAWPGLMGYALHKMPLIGQGPDGQWYATAFGGHGLNTTAMGGLLLAKAIAGGDDSYRRFAPFGPRWAFGQLGRLGVQGSYWMMQLRDKIDERRRGGAS